MSRAVRRPSAPKTHDMVFRSRMKDSGINDSGTGAKQGESWESASRRMPPTIGPLEEIAGGLLQDLFDGRCRQYALGPALDVVCLGFFDARRDLFGDLAEPEPE
jgi:hypothetical protein